MMRARRYRISLVFAVVFVLLILHFSRSHDQPAAFQVPLPAPPIDHKPPFPGQSIDRPVKDDDYSVKKPIVPPPAPARPASSEEPQQQPPQQHQSPYTSDEVSSPTINRPDSSYDTPSEDEELGHKPQTGAQTQGIHDHEIDEDLPTAPHWKPTPEQHPIDLKTLIKLPTGSSKSLPQLQAKFADESSADKMQRLQQLNTIKTAFLHAWNGYKVSAMGHDEVKPLRGGFKDPFNGWGATLVDSLDTLWIMDLKQEFSMAVDFVKKIDFTVSKRKEIPVFETVIRYLGGLLGAYDVSGHKYDVLLEKAVELAEVLMGAFDTPNRMPTLYYKWNPDYASSPRRGDFKAVLAELGSLSLEFTRLAQLTKDDKYYDAIARITNELEKYQHKTKLPGLWPLNLDASGCRRPVYEPELETDEEEASVGQPVRGPAMTYETRSNSTSPKALYSRGIHEDAEPAYYGDDDSSDTDSLGTRTPPPKQDCFEGLNNQLSNTDRFGLGALGDSTYEYLPKEYMLLGGNNEQYQNMYTKAMDTVREQLVYQPMLKNHRDVRFLATVTMTKNLDANPPGRTTFAYEGTHLTCFAGGMFAIGAKLFGLEKDLRLGSQLTDGCVWAYESTKTGIMPEAFKLVPCEKGEQCEWSEEAYYAAMDPYAEKRPGPLGKRSAEPEKGNWHVKAIPDSPTSTGNKGTSSAAVIEDFDNRNPDPVPVKGVLSHEEFVTDKILNDRLPPGMTGISSRQYLLRPEAIESVFIMYRLTGDSYWREKGWKMFQAIDKATKTELAHSAIADVTVDDPRPLDSMESFWLAETLKYFYLLFSDPSLVSLDEYVLNTEAHPFKRPEY
ncbi:Putative Class I alpha-mannosidase 1A [Source:UniProtKB/TrEMBL;Acc:Q9HF84] [Aspergillus calidoustus]|uniref:alpha-1,2-Mannosidase n=1 Tax=Aspergillus calidoustus TaxID=454130 RepID=A0A0U5GMI5_ASPCI|nr:Putative Class I alpha-mannosidase 1A [Source:UniProtKB/TrEMBL;Acc:Q9HF84] [Aspergillus calidoustus]